MISEDKDMGPDERIGYLLLKQTNGTLTDAERQELTYWVHASAENEARYYESIHPESLQAGLNWLNVQQQKLQDTLDTKLPGVYTGEETATEDNMPATGGVIALKKVISIAAAILIVLTGTYLWYHNSTGKTTAPVARQEIFDKPPGKKGALLKLADGHVIELDTMMAGAFNNQGNTLTVQNGAQLSYGHEKPLSDAPVLFNTLTTPLGRQINVSLADGSKVYLNAGSSLTYPTVFKGQQRVVELTGEAYFEVAANKAMPFIVKVAGKQEVKVLGTHFNINAYEDEAAITTSLLEGSVKITTPTGSSLVLKPGQQALQPNNGYVLSMQRIQDEQSVLAWKSGLFYFIGEDLQTVMRQLARWYNIRVEYKGVLNKKLIAVINNNVSLQDIIKMLRKNGLQCELSADKLTIRPV